MGIIEITRRGGHTATAQQRDRLRTRLRRTCCSEPWVDVCLAAVERHKHLNARHPERGLARAAIYPPGGATTLMRVCIRCGVWSPPQTVNLRGLCDCCVSELLLSDAHWQHLPSSGGPIVRRDQI